MEFSTAQTQLKSTERVLRRRPITREHHCVAVESRAQAGKVLRKRREDLELTQQGLADHAQVGLSSVKRLEGGQRLERKVERKIARGLGWSDSSVDLVFAGKAPVMRAEEVAAERAEAQRFQADVLTMTLEEMARLAAFVAQVRRDPLEGDALMEDMLRIRREAAGPSGADHPDTGS